MRKRVKEPIHPKALEVVMKVAELFEVPVSDIFSKCRKKEMITARHTAIHRLYNMQGCSPHKKAGIVRIGDWFGMDHTSVIHAKKNVQNWIDTYPDYKVTYNTLIRATFDISYSILKPLTLEERISRLPKDDIDAIVSFVDKMEKKYLENKKMSKSPIF